MKRKKTQIIAMLLVVTLAATAVDEYGAIPSLVRAAGETATSVADGGNVGVTKIDGIPDDDFAPTDADIERSLRRLESYEHADGSDVKVHLIDPVNQSEDTQPTYSNTGQGSTTRRKKANGSYPWLVDTYMTKYEWYIDDIEATTAWTAIEDRGRHPGQDIVVAVVDTGVDITHPDLADNIWVNEAELNGTPGVDDDGNGYVDDIYGGNLVNPGATMTDTHGHGTSMAGAIGMIAGNAPGSGVGVAYGVKIMPVRVSTGDEFSVNAAIAGFRYALKNGADIISMSFSTDMESAAMKSAIEELSSSCILVAAAGNEARSMATPGYPAAYDEVTGVMSYGSGGTISYFSNWDSSPNSGEEYEIAAPGEDIFSTIPGSKFEMDSGTSPATAITAGAMAVVLSELRSRGYNPTPANFKKYFLGNITHSTTPDSTHGNFTYKRLNLSDVINYATIALDTSTPTPTPTATPTVVPTVAPTATAQATVPPISTVEPTTTPTAEVSPTQSPGDNGGSDGSEGLTKGSIVKAGKGAKRAYYLVTDNIAHTVRYYSCEVTKGKKAIIPAYIILSDGVRYRVIAVRKRAFSNRKKITKVLVYPSTITRKMMRKAIKGSKVKKIVFR